MKRSKKLLTLLLVLVLLMGATYAAAKVNPENEPETEEPGTVIFSLDPDAVSELSWDYSEALSLRREDGNWIYTADENFPVDETYLDTMLETLKEVTAQKAIEAPEDLDQYGLEVPICVVTADAAALHIGAETALGGKRYVSTGDGNVYLTDTAILEAFSYGLYDILACETLPEMNEITAFRLESEAQNYEIIYQENSPLAYSDRYVWFWEDTVLDTELTEELIDCVTGLSWLSCADYNAEDMTLYGLDNPAAVTVDYEGGSFTLELGSTDSGTFARIAGSNMVYEIDPGIADTLLHTTRQELLPDEVLVMAWNEVDAIGISTGGKTCEITKQVNSTTGKDGTTVEKTVYLLNGREGNASKVTAALDALDSVGYATGLTPEQKASIQFTFRRDTEHFPEVALAFYPYDSTSCIAELNGAVTVLVSRNAVSDLIDTVASLSA